MDDDQFFVVMQAVAWEEAKAALRKLATIHGSKFQSGSGERYQSVKKFIDDFIDKAENERYIADA